MRWSIVIPGTVVVGLVTAATAATGWATSGAGGAGSRAHAIGCRTEVVDFVDVERGESDDGGRDQDVHARRADCSIVKVATADDMNEYQPALDPDRAQVVYVASRGAGAELRVTDIGVDSGGSTHTVLTSEGNIGDPTWSPDAKQIAFWRDPGDGRPQIWVLDLASGQSTAVTDGASPEAQPSWSPDGTSLAFTRTNTDGRGSQIVTIDLASGTATALGDERYVKEPVWSPDGGEIAAVKVDPDAALGSTPAQAQIAVLDSTTGRLDRQIGLGQAMPLGLGWAEDRIVAVAGMVDQVNTVEVQEFDAASLQLQHSSIDSDGIPSVDPS